MSAIPNYRQYIDSSQGQERAMVCMWFIGSFYAYVRVPEQDFNMGDTEWLIHEAREKALKLFHEKWAEKEQGELGFGFVGR